MHSGMQDSHFVKMSKEEYEHIARALIVYDHLLHRVDGRLRDRAGDVADLQDRWGGDGERFGVRGEPEDREAVFRDAFQTIDAFLETETWHELAWWIAEREYKRLAKDCRDREAREVVMDSLYHQVMEEFFHHGVDRLQIPDIPGNTLPPQRVASALKALRAQTRAISRGPRAGDRRS